MRDSLTDILASCLDSIEQGERTVEECLSFYSEQRKDLEALLRTVATIRERADFTPRPGFRQASRTRLLRNLSARGRTVPWRPVRQVRLKDQLILPKRWGLFRAMLLVLLAISLIGGGTVYAAGDALPGDMLYPLKLSTEDVRLFVSDDDEDVSLAIEFAQTRMEEMQALIDSGREEDLDLAANQLSNRIAFAAESLAAVAEDDPERAAQAALVLERALSIHTDVLTSHLETIPDQAKPAIERAIQASSRGKEVVQDLFKDGLPADGPPDGSSGPGKDPPRGGPAEDAPGPEKKPSGGGPPDGGPNSAGPPPGGGPPDGVPGPPDWVPGDRP